jgi:hypothetical protein
MVIGIHYSESFNVEELACYRAAHGNPDWDHLTLIRSLQECLEMHGKKQTFALISQGREVREKSRKS